MIMDKISNYEDDDSARHNVEGFVLDKLFTQHSIDGEGHSVNIGELTDSLDPKMSPLFDQAIEDLIAQGLIHSEDGENYEITYEGVREVENRKKDPIPL
jgi:Mn-dependent DtxR family transcriptional regulator